MTKTHEAKHGDGLLAIAIDGLDTRMPVALLTAETIDPVEDKTVEVTISLTAGELEWLIAEGMKALEVLDRHADQLE